MIISPLIKNIINPIENIGSHKSNAMKILSNIISSENFALIDRYFRPNLFDKNPIIKKAALISGIKMFVKSEEVIKKWLPELHEILFTNFDNNPHIQFLALILISKSKNNDPLSFSKVFFINSQQ